MGLASYFALRQWDFTDNNIQGTLKKMSEHDKAEFQCDVESFTWLEYMRNYYLGLRKYILKDDESTIPAAVKRYRK
jgi:fatty acyl-CoA reductase